MDNELFCWKCHASLAALPVPLSRRAECPACNAELHVCRQCRHYDTAKAKQCRELAADEVNDKTRANFCDWFQARTGAVSGSSPSGGSRAALDALFGGPAPEAAPGGQRSDLDKLFGQD